MLDPIGKPVCKTCEGTKGFWTEHEHSGGRFFVQCSRCEGRGYRRGCVGTGKGARYQ